MNIGKLMLRTTTLAGLLATLAGVSPNNLAPAAFAEETVYAAVPLAPQGAVEAPAVSSSNGTTTLYIQNKEANAGSVFVTFYKEDGTSVDITACLSPGGNAAGTPIAANGQLVLNYGTCSALADGDKGSSVVSSDVDVAVINRTEYASNKNNAAQKGLSSGGSLLTLPLLLRNYTSKQTSSFTIQNTDSVSRTALIKFYASGSSTIITDTTVVLPPFTAKEYDLSLDALFATFPSSYIGSATIEAVGGIGNFIAGADLRLNRGGLGATDPISQSIYSYNGFTSGDTTLYAPIARKNHANGYSTGIQIANTTNVDASVGIQYFGNPAVNAASPLQLVTVPANSSLNVFQGSNAGANPLPAPWLGSARITSTQPIVALVNDSLGNISTIGRFTAAAYNTFSLSQAANTLYAPLVRRKVGTSLMSTGVQVQNVGNTSAIVRIDYVAGNGSPTISGNQLFDEVTIPPGESKFFVQSNNSYNRGAFALPDGFFGSAKISAVTSSGGTTVDTAAKLIAIVNDVARATGANSADSSLYEADK